MADALKKADILDETVTSLGWDMRLGLCFAVSTIVPWSKLREIAQSFSMHSDLYTPRIPNVGWMTRTHIYIYIVI